MKFDRAGRMAQGAEVVPYRQNTAVGTLLQSVQCECYVTFVTTVHKGLRNAPVDSLSHLINRPHRTRDSGAKRL